MQGNNDIGSVVINFVTWGFVLFVGICAALA